VKERETVKKSLLIKGNLGCLTLNAKTAVDLMTPDVETIHDRMTVKEAVAFLTTHGFSAAPVVDCTGKPVGVLSQTDIVKYDYEKVEHVHEAPAPEHRGKLVTQWGERLRGGYQVEAPDDTPVRDIMTPVLFSVEPGTPVPTVVDALLALGVHRLFVLNAGGRVVGVISALDVLRHLCHPDRPRGQRAKARGQKGLSPLTLGL
jgi:CBS domain-containing protein